MEKRHIIFENNFKPYKVRFNFSKKRSRFFLFFEKDLERNEKFCRSVFRKRKGFLFYVQPNGKTPYTFYRKVIVAENGIYSKGVKSVDTRTKFPYN